MKGLLAVLKKIDDHIYSVQKIFILVAVAIMVITNGAQVFCRYVLHSSLLMYLVLVMLGANLAVKTDSETKIDVLSPKDPKKNAMLRLVCDIFSLVAIVAFIRSAVALVRYTAQFPNNYSSLKISYNYCYVWLIIGFSLIFIDKIINLIKNICIVKGEDISDLYPETKTEKEAEA